MQYWVEKHEEIRRGAEVASQPSAINNAISPDNTTSILDKGITEFGNLDSKCLVQLFLQLPVESQKESILWWCNAKTSKE